MSVDSKIVEIALGLIIRPFKDFHQKLKVVIQYFDTFKVYTVFEADTSRRVEITRTQAELTKY